MEVLVKRNDDLYLPWERKDVKKRRSSKKVYG